MSKSSEYKNQTILTALEGLQSKDGRLTPKKVLEAAADPDHVLHGEFDWDDTTAARKWRLEQARKLIRSVEINITVDLTTVTAIGYVRDPASGDEQGYVSTEQLQREPENARLMLIQEFSRAESLVRRAELLAKAVGMEKEVASVVRKIRSVRAKVEELQ